MSATPHTRWTAFSDAWPVGHGEDRDEALKEAGRRLRAPFRVTHVIERLRAYPFTELRRERVAP